MKPIFRALAVAVSLGLASAAGVAMAGDDTSGKNPISRGGKDPFHSGPLYATPHNGTDLGGIGRPAPRSHSAQVTPVPEPSQWAMMIAGLALVGFIVRRNRQK